ncbi:glutamine ABC transporter substrate-binding protein [Mariniluteicoccus endophyticus]
MKMRRIAAAAVALVTATTVSACGGGGQSATTDKNCTPKHQFDTVKKGQLTVSFYDLPPFTKAEGKKITGVDGEILDEIAKMECLTIAPQPLAAAAVIPAVQAGRADIAAADWYRTKSRNEIVTLSDPMYLDQMAIISKDGTKSVQALKGKKVGTVDGYMWVEDMKKLLGDDLKVYPSTLNMNQDLKAGRIEIGIDSYGSGVFNNPDLKVEVVEKDPTIAGTLDAAQASFPMPKGKDALAKAINEDIAELHKNGKIKEILVKHKLDASAADVGEPRLL